MGKAVRVVVNEHNMSHSRLVARKTLHSHSIFNYPALYLWHWRSCTLARAESKASAMRMMRSLSHFFTSSQSGAFSFKVAPRTKSPELSGSEGGWLTEKMYYWYIYISFGSVTSL
jgi:hypothetical protein